jgi:hypothetical protein
VETDVTVKAGEKLPHREKFHKPFFHFLMGQIMSLETL